MNAREGKTLTGKEVIQNSKVCLREGLAVPKGIGNMSLQPASIYGRFTIYDSARMDCRLSLTILGVATSSLKGKSTDSVVRATGRSPLRQGTRKKFVGILRTISFVRD